MAWGGYRHEPQLCWEGERKAKVKLELNMARDTKNHKGLYEYGNQKRKLKGKVYEL